MSAHVSNAFYVCMRNCVCICKCVCVCVCVFVCVSTHKFTCISDFVHKPFHRGKFLQQQRLEGEISTHKHHIITNPRVRHTHIRTHTLSLSHSHTPTNTHTPTHKHTHTHTNTHTLTHNVNAQVARDPGSPDVSISHHYASPGESHTHTQTHTTINKHTYTHLHTRTPLTHTHTRTHKPKYHVITGSLGESVYTCREVGGWGRDPFSRNFMKPTPRRKWYLTTGRRFH